jgi:hypothetical protein
LSIDSRELTLTDIKRIYIRSFAPERFKALRGILFYTVAQINLLLFVKPFLKDFQHTSFQHMGMTNKAE